MTNDKKNKHPRCKECFVQQKPIIIPLCQPFPWQQLENFRVASFLFRDKHRDKFHCFLRLDPSFTICNSELSFSEFMMKEVPFSVSKRPPGSPIITEIYVIVTAR